MARTASELAHLFRALKAPAAARALPALADRAREEAWSYEHFAEVLLGTEVNARESHGGEGRIKAARFPARKTLEVCPMKCVWFVVIESGGRVADRSETGAPEGRAALTGRGAAPREDPSPWTPR